MQNKYDINYCHCFALVVNTTVLFNCNITNITRELAMSSKAANDEGKQINFLKSAVDFCTKTSAHGLGGVATASSRKARLMWLCFFLLCFTTCFCELIWIILRFYRFDVTVDVLTVREKSLQFPAITICNLNRFKRSKIRGTRLENITVSICIKQNLFSF